MIYSTEVKNMCSVCKGAYHGPAPIPEEGKWIQAKEIKDISGYTHGIGWCAPQQGACKLSLNVKDGIIEEALVETIGCTGMTHSAAMASEILPGKTLPRRVPSRRAVCPSAQVWKTSVRDFVRRRVRSTAPVPRARATSNSPRATSPSSSSTKTTRFAVTNTFTSAKSWKPSRAAWTLTRRFRRTPAPTVARLRSRVQ